MDIYAKIATKIIEQQQTIIGPVAVEQAQAVSGLTVDWDKHDVKVSGNGASVIDKLVAQYKELFGQIAVETCKEAAASMLPKLGSDQVPASLR